MEAQEIFDKVATHLFTQGERALADGKGCRYYAEETGYSCAVGCLLTPEQGILADKAPVGSTDVETIAAKGYLPEALMPFLPLLIRLQDVHDSFSNWETTEEMRDSLKYAAQGHTMPVDPAILDTLSFKNR